MRSLARGLAFTVVLLAARGLQAGEPPVAAATGQVTVTATPPDGVTLQLTGPDGLAVAAVAPWSNAAAPVGPWRAVGHADGYQDDVQAFEVLPDKLVFVKLELKKLGALAVTGEPPGARVAVTGPDGFLAEGALPWERAALKSGSYHVEVSRAGCATEARDVAVVVETTSEVKVALARLSPATLAAIHGGPPLEGGTVAVEPGQVEPLAPKPIDTAESSGPPEPPALAPGERPVTLQASLAFAEGFVRTSGVTVRTPVTLEPLLSLAAKAVPWLRLDAAFAMTVEQPVGVLLRPGLRLFAGRLPIYARVAAQVEVRPDIAGGILLGAGGEIPLPFGISLPLEIDVSLWPKDIARVPVDFKFGIAYSF